MLSKKLSSATGESQQFVVVGSSALQFLYAYEWDDNSGVGTAFSAPSPLPTHTINDVAVTPQGNAVIAAMDGGDYLVAYAFTKSGWGTKYSNPGTLPTGQGRRVTLSKSGDTVIVGTGASPYLAAYPWNSATGFGAKYSDPSTLPPHGVDDVAFHPSGQAVAVCYPLSPPYVDVYEWSGAGFGNLYSTPSTFPSSPVTAVTFSPDGNVIAMTSSSSPFVHAYAWTLPWPGGGFGTKFSNPGSFPSGAGVNLTFDRTGTRLLVLSGSSPYNRNYIWSNSTGFGTNLSAVTFPDAAPSGPNNIGFNVTGSAVGASSAGSGASFSARRWDGSNFGTAYTISGVIFSPTAFAFGSAS